MSETTSPSQRRRVDVFDGLRGIAIILVVLSHGWTLWPSVGLRDNRWIWNLFGSGNFAVSIFFVISFFLATAGLLRKVDSPVGLRPLVELLRRYLRLTGQVAFLLLAVALVTVFDSTDTYPDTETRTSIVRILTYTWNWYLRDHALVARPDLGHLWYLSVDLQVYAFLLILLFILRRHRVWLIAVLTATLIVCFMWRSHVFETEGVYQALIRTTVRADAPLTGALAAAALPYLGVLRHYARQIAALSVLALIPLLHFNRPDTGYFEWPGAALDIALGLFVVSCTLAPAPRAISVVLARRPLVFLGRRSLALYIWHYPVFWFVARHSEGWAWGWRTLVALAIALAAALISELTIERRVQRLLASDGWHELEAGVRPFITRRVRRGVERARSQVRDGHRTP
jgi:peptidoglycan/LPS O-acetylase OafA/YrhL